MYARAFLSSVPLLVPRLPEKQQQMETKQILKRKQAPTIKVTFINTVPYPACLYELGSSMFHSLFCTTQNKKYVNKQILTLGQEPRKKNLSHTNVRDENRARSIKTGERRALKTRWKNETFLAVSHCTCASVLARQPPLTSHQARYRFLSYKRTEIIFK